MDSSTPSPSPSGRPPRPSDSPPKPNAPVPFGPILDQIPEAILALDANGRITYANASAQALAQAEHGPDGAGGKPHAAPPGTGLLGRALLDAFPSLRGSPVEGACREAASSRGRVVCETPGPIPGRVFSFSLFPTADGLSVQIQDVTDRHLIEQQLLDASARLNLHVDSSPLAVIEWDDQFRVARWSAGAQRVFGWTEHEMVGRSMSEVRWVHDDDLENVRQVAQGLIDGTAHRNFSANRNYRKDGSIVYCRWFNSALYDAAGRMTSTLSLVLDVTATHQVEEALWERQEQFRLFVMYAPVAMAMFDNHMRYLVASARWLSDFGLEGLPILGQSHYDVFPEIPMRWKKIHAQCLAGQAQHAEEDPFIRADGSVQWLRWDIQPWRTSTGQIGGLIIFSEDITRRKETQRLAQVLNSINEVVHSTLEFDQVMHRATTRAAEALRCQSAIIALRRGERCVVQYVHGLPQEAVGQTLHADFEPYALEAIRTRTPVAVSDTDTDPRVDRQRMREHGIRSVLAVPLLARGEAIGVLLLNSHQTPGAFHEAYVNFGIHLAATLASAVENAWLYGDLRRAQEGLRASEARAHAHAQEVQAIMDAVPALVWIAHDPDCLHITGNRAADAFLRLPSGREASLTAPPDARPTHFVCIRDGRVIPGHELPVQRAARGEVVRDAEHDVVFNDGQAFRLFGHAVPLHDEAGRPRGCVAAFVDITQRRTAEENLRRLNLTLEQRVADRTAEARRRADQLQNLATEMTQVENRERHRMATILHDHLQQLLVAAKMRVSLLEDEVATDPARREVREIEETLAQSIEVSRTLTAELSPAVLHDAGLAAGFNWLGRWMHAHHKLEVHVVADPAAEPGDDDLRAFLFRSTRELLFNIVKHAGVAKAELTLGCAAPGDMIEITVEDHGRGFSPDRLTAHDTTGFSGLGLFGIRERLGLLGGRLVAQSSPGKGTRVSLLLPIARRPKPAPAPAPAQTLVSVPAATLPAPAGVPAALPRAPQKEASAPGVAPAAEAAGPARIRVLIADDHKIVRQGLAGLLARQPGLDVVGEAPDGQVALDLARALCPDVVLMDVNMPVLDGVEATRQLAAQAAGPRVIALSMHDDPSVIARMRDAGAIEYISKDASLQTIAAAIRRCAADPRTREPVTPA